MLCVGLLIVCLGELVCVVCGNVCSGFWGNECVLSVEIFVVGLGE